MRVRLSNFGLPMLAKDLAEMAQRPRTYLVRVAFALLLFSTSALVFLPAYRAASFSPKGLMGQGGQLLDVLYVIESVALCLFVPAIVSGALAAEKERNTLQLLFLTRLGPWAILIEKLLSRLVPVATFLLISSPLLLVGYLMGGLTLVDLEFAVAALVVTAFEVACVSLFCSAWCATSAAAFVMSYVTMAALFVFPYLVVAFYMAIETWWRKVIGGYPAVFRWFDQPAWQPIVRMAITSTHGFSAEWLFPQGMGPGPPRPFHRQIIPLCVSALSGIVCLVMARRVIVLRAAPQPKYRVRQIFRWLDRVFTRLNNRYGRGIVFSRTGDDLPDASPIAWRENRRGNLGQLNYMIRMVLVLEVPILLPTMLYVETTHDFSFNGLLVTGMLLWTIAFLVVFVRAAGLIAAEKARQTLDVLLTTPLPIEELAGDKLRGMRRTMAVVSVGILIHALFVDGLQPAGRPPHVFETIVNLVILLNLGAQLAFLAGLRSKTQGRAVRIALGAFVAWCFIPLVVRVFGGFDAWILYFSPIGGFLVNQFPELAVTPRRPGMMLYRPDSGGFLAAMHYLFYAAIVGLLILVNLGIGRQVLLRPRTVSQAPSSQPRRFLEP